MICLRWGSGEDGQIDLEKNFRETTTTRELLPVVAADGSKAQIRAPSADLFRLKKSLEFGKKSVPLFHTSTESRASEIDQKSPIRKRTRRDTKAEDLRDKVCRVQQTEFILVFNFIASVISDQ